MKLTLALAGTLFLGGALSTAGDARAQAKPDKDRVRIGYAARAVARSVPYVADKLYGGQAK